MDVLEAQKTRHSIRKYQQKPVEQEKIDAILTAAMQGPSAVNERPWHFIVITDKAVLSEIPKVSAHAQMVPAAALAIVVCGDTGLLKIDGLWQQDCAIASTNILLAAHSLGLGAVWTAAYPLPGRATGIQKILGLPENVIPLSVIPIGYPAEQKPVTDRFDKSRVHKDRW
ncbi:MAG: nitroreductase family protein [Candidatus Micrarchaeia archaeon]